MGEGMMATTKKVLEYVEFFIDTRGYSPTIREIAAELGLSTGAIHSHLELLRDMALISWTPGKARTIVLPEDRPEGVWEE